ncbi:copper-transporting ATPase, partial [Cymbomonas tetramitiformis]
DHPDAVAAVAVELGLPLDKVHGGVRPADKAAFVVALQREGRQVAMVGDGVNDTAALAEATLGIAMGGGVGAATEVASVVLLRDDISQVAAALQLSKATFQKIQQNLVWAFAYNIVGIPVAAGAALPLCGIMLTPSIAAAFMGVSSLGVMANSLLLQATAPHVGAITARLEHVNAEVRRTAVEAVGRLGEHAAPHVGAIAARLEDSDANVRRRRTAAWEAGSMQRRTMEPVVKWLEDSDANEVLAVEAVGGSGRLGACSAGCLEPITARLEHVGCRTPHAGAIAARLDHANASVRCAAVEALGRLMEHAAPHAGGIAARLEDANADERWAAVEAVGRLGEHAAPHVGAIAARLDDINEAVICAAVEALGRLGEHAAPHAGAIAARVEDTNAEVMGAAVKTLASLGEHAAPHAGAIAARLQDANASVRCAAVEALGRLGEHAAPHAEAIAARLQDANGCVRFAAVEALGRLGEHAAPHAGAIAARLEHANADMIIL